MKKIFQATVLTKKDKEILMATAAASFIAVLVILTVSSIQVVDRGAHFAANTYAISFNKNEG